MHNEQTNKPKNFKASLQRLLKYLSFYKKSLIFVAICTVISSIISIFSPKILGLITTKLYEGISKEVISIDFDYILKIIIVLIVIYLVSFLFSYLSGRVMGKINQKLIYRLREEVDQKLTRLPLKFYDKYTNGEIISRISNDIDVVSDGLQETFTQILRSFIDIIGIIIMMLYISVKLSFVTFLVIPISLGLISFIVSKSQKYFERQKKVLGDLNSQIEETYAGHLVIKAFNQEKNTVDNFEKLNQELYHVSWKSNLLSGLMQPIIKLVSNMGYVFICILGANLVLEGKIKIGDIQAFIQYSRQFMHPLVDATEIVTIMQSVTASAERIFEILDYEEMEQEEKGIVLKDVKGKVEVKNVSFSYNKEEELITNLNFTAKPGQTIAIVGPTGAGKTTIVNLLMRFYEIDGGDILIDGVSTREMKREDVRSLFGMVLQDTWAFTGTIQENLKYAKSDATVDEIVEACTLAHADGFIRSLPNSYHFLLNEEASNISSGQKQLLTIARAILANKPILILDEATSNVDTRTEILIGKAMNNLMKGRTSFVIAHRLSTIKNADLILVMDKGKVIEQGTHQELLKKNGFYAKLYNAQFDN